MAGPDRDRSPRDDDQDEAGGHAPQAGQNSREGIGMNWPADNLERWQDFTGQQAIHEATGKTFAEMAANLPTQPDTAREQVEEVS